MADDFPLRSKEEFKIEMEKLAKEKRYQTSEELVVPVIFDVCFATYNSDVSYSDNGIIGPGGHSWPTGVSPRLEMDVSPRDGQNIPIKRLGFDGFAFVKKGDIIRAYVGKYEEKNEMSWEFFEHNRSYFAERDFKESELATKIELLTQIKSKSKMRYQVLAEFNASK